MSQNKQIPVHTSTRINPDEIDPRALYSGDLVKWAIADTKERDLQIIIEDFIPLIQILAALDVARAKFDECVISRGAGFMSDLNERQQRMYDIYSDLQEFCKVYDILVMLEDATPLIMSRTAAYHDFMKGRGSYEDLLLLARQDNDNISLVDRAIERQGRAGRPEGTIDPVKLFIGKRGAELRKDGLTDAEIGNNLIKEFNPVQRPDDAELYKKQQAAIMRIVYNTKGKKRSKRASGLFIGDCIRLYSRNQNTD